MLAAIMIMSLLAIISVAVLTSAGASRRRAIRYTRAEVRENCAQAGLNYARGYFANNFGNWSTYLSTPSKYNPMFPAGTSTSWAKAAGSNDLNRAAVIAAVSGPNPELLVDLDSDANPDVYIFIRDNYDEFPPAAPDFTVDNDQNVIVGALCISQTMAPRRENNTIDQDALLAESLLGYNMQGNAYTGQSLGGGGTGNRNN
jgi:type II secretory pathway pseudopilin PulG